MPMLMPRCCRYDDAAITMLLLFTMPLCFLRYLVLLRYCFSLYCHAITRQRYYAMLALCAMLLCHAVDASDATPLRYFDAIAAYAIHTATLP